MSEDKRRILEMLSQGKISVEEAEQLLRAVEPSSSAATATAERSDAAGTASPPPRWLRLSIFKAGTEISPKKEVDIRVPMALVRAGMRLSSLIPGVAGGAMKRRLNLEGTDVDLSKLDSAHLEDLLNHIGEMTIDVEDKVQIRVTSE